MGNVIKMDVYRLVTSLSFKICLIVVFLLNLAEGPITKIVYNVTKMIYENSSAEDAAEQLRKLGDWVADFHLGNIIAAQLGNICTVVFLLCIVYFCFADIQHGYIKNIAGQLPSRGHTIVSKFVVIQFTILVFYVISVIGNVAGQLIVGKSMKFDMFFSGETDIITGTETASQTFSMLQAFAEFGIKFLLLSGLCALILLLTTGIGSNVAGTIVAVICGAGFSGLAYSGISAGIKKLFSLDEFELSKYMPDSLYRTDLFKENCVLRSLIAAVITIVVLMYFTTKLYNKKDIK